MPAGEAVVGAVLQADGVVEIGGPHHAEHGAEALGAVEPRTGRHADPHARRPQLGVPVDLAGSTSHDSPSSSAVRARSSGPDGGRITGPTEVARSVAGPTARLRVASASRRRKAGSS